MNPEPSPDLIGGPLAKVGEGWWKKPLFELIITYACGCMKRCMCYMSIRFFYFYLKMSCIFRSFRRGFVQSSIEKPHLW